ncbi:unnamed protein product [Rotaria sp. Silwood1]|nr:unnamed protein product [Rotaria sp. Silwood1]
MYPLIPNGISPMPDKIRKIIPGYISIVRAYITLVIIPITYDPIVSTIPVAIKTSAYSLSLTNFVKCDRNTAITTKNKHPINTALHTHTQKKREILLEK